MQATGSYGIRRVIDASRSPSPNRVVRRHMSTTAQSKPMNPESWLVRKHTTIPRDAVQDEFIALCEHGKQHADNHIFIDVPDEASDISPNEKVTVHIHSHESGEFAGRVSVMVAAVRHQDSIAAGIPTGTLISAPAYYLTEAGMRSIRPNAENTIYARWRLARPTRLAPVPPQ